MPASYSPIIFIAAAVALSIMGDGALYTLLPSHYVNIDLTPFQVGILLSVNRWIRLVSNHLAERCYRRLPVSPLLAIAFFLGSLVTAAYGCFKIFLILLLARIFWGISLSFTRQAGLMTVVSTLSNIHLGKGMGIHRSIALVGFFFGSLIGGIVYDTYGFIWVFVSFALLSLGSIPLGLLSQSGLQAIQPIHLDRRLPKANYRILVCGFAVGLVGFGMILSTLGLIVKERVGASIHFFDFTIGAATLTGVMLAVRWGLDIVGSPVLGALADRIGRQRSIPVVFIIGAISLASASLAFGVIWMLGSVLVFFLCAALLGVLISAWAGEHGARGVASYLTAYDFGAALGPLIGWSLAQFGLPSDLIFITGAVFYLAGALVSSRLLDSGHTADPPRTLNTVR